MKTSLDHLPSNKRAELDRIVELILAAGDPDMVILFGSHARGDWVDDCQVEGKNLFDYQSDYDIYVLTRLAKHIDRFARNEQLRRRLHEIVPAPVSLIADTSRHFNEALERGRYFYVDVVKEGILLFDSGRIRLSQPRELTPAERLQEAAQSYEYWFECAADFLIAYELMFERGRYVRASFQLHQAVEHLTTTVLLVLTSYKPKGHDIEKRLKQCAALDARFANVFPVDDPDDRRRFELLRDAYVGARYHKDFHVAPEDLQRLVIHVQTLKDLTQQLAEARMAELAARADAG